MLHRKKKVETYLLAVFLIAGCDAKDRVVSYEQLESKEENSSDDDDSQQDDDDSQQDDDDSDVDAGADDGIQPTPIEIDCSECAGVGPSMDNMICALDLCDPASIAQNEIAALTPMIACDIESTYEAVEHFGDPGNDLAPWLNGSYALLATGLAEGEAHSTDCGNMTGAVTDEFSDEDYPTYDNVEWTIAVRAPENAHGFRFKYVFLSEEYDEWISSVFNDKFYVVLQAMSTNGGEKTIINFTECRDPDAYYDFICEEDDIACEEGHKYCYIAINSAYSDCCWYPAGSGYAPDPTADSCPDFDEETRCDITGTGFACAALPAEDSQVKGSSTGWLQTTWPIEPGEVFVITFHLHDTSDGIYDSEVILDAFEFLSTPVDNKTGTIEVGPVV